MLINLTNHPSEKWSEEQLKAAHNYGEIVDIQFPIIDENATEIDIKQLADKYTSTILDKGKAKDLIVHIMGEQTFCYALISKLQKEGIRCIASCTKSDSFYNEAGQKISTFHFSQFREYHVPKTFALKQWYVEKKENCKDLFCKWEFLHRKKFYSSIALTLILLCEFLLVGYLQLNWPVLWIITIAACLLPTLILVGRIFGQRFSIASPIVTKLLANAVTPSFWGTFYLFMFVIHIGWLANAVLGWYTEENDLLCRVWLSTLVCVFGMYFLIVFFPKGNEQKVEKPQKVFISGISAISTRPEDLDKMVYDRLNLLPLVRILQLAIKDDVVPKMVILQTDAFKDTDVFNKAFLRVLELTNPEALPDLDNCNGINEKLELLIREVAKREFPEMARRKIGNSSFIDNISIEFTTEACNYSKNFEKAYTILNEKTKGLDDIHHCLYFNLTPGTGIIGSLMTLMAIDGDRHLYYYSQEPMPLLGSDEEKRKFRESLVLPVDKSKVPLQALLSQALEKQN